MSKITAAPPDVSVHDLAAIRKGILDARRDFPRVVDFYTGECQTHRFKDFLATGDYYTDELTRRAWKTTMFKEIDRVEKLFLIP
jgi:hypothetical protein